MDVACNCGWIGTFEEYTNAGNECPNCLDTPLIETRSAIKDGKVQGRGEFRWLVRQYPESIIVTEFTKGGKDE